MSKTTNYQLALWDYDAEDFSPGRVREDLAANFTKLDAALKAEETARKSAVTAEANARTTGLAGKVGIAVGSYTGNDESERTISLGFTPKAVYLCSESGYAGYASGSLMCYGGLILPGQPVKASGSPMAEIVTGGIKVYNRSTFLTTNSAYYKYHYIAFR